MDYKKELLDKLHAKLNHDLDMDGFGNGYEQGINEAIEVVKNLTMHGVVNQRELLFAFIKEIKEEYIDQNWDYLEFIAERVLSK